ncbi:hypothetical protein SSX86_023594 [Deinandra increscens subsp. villosa]|uniref:Uncharacterized protein n=1 Tax=Deinandra increscens subsp. villosa TaxID=3103831 RepID=A0AAP0GSA6_9ASTR
MVIRHASTTSLSFKVRRSAPELIAPATLTPREVKLLSDIDDQAGLRYRIPMIFFYPRNPNMGNINPASVIREALAKVLVFYYPLAGRIKEGPGGKLMVDCTGEGVLFVEAEADVTLEQFGKSTLHPPFPCVDELLCDVPGSGDIVGSPLVQIQVTRLLCGAFIFTTRIYHTMFDGTGVAQFLTALGEIAQGAVAPSILPIWERGLLCARDPPCITFPHPEYDDVVDTEINHIIATYEMADKSFFFGPTEMSALRRFVPENLKNCSTFEVLTACLWRCRAIALQEDPEKHTRLMFFANARAKFNPPIPIGYYGNWKSCVTEEYVRSTADLMVVKGRPHFKTDSTYIVSNITRLGFNKVNFGWGEALYAGLPRDDQDIPGVFSDYMPSINDKMEHGIVVIIGLPIPAMKRFIEELNVMLK